MDDGEGALGRSASLLLAARKSASTASADTAAAEFEPVALFAPLLCHRCTLEGTSRGARAWPALRKVVGPTRDKFRTYIAWLSSFAELHTRKIQAHCNSDIHDLLRANCLDCPMPRTSVISGFTTGTNTQTVISIGH